MVKNTRNRAPRANREAVNANNNSAIDLHEFESLAADSIEHSTVPGFFARFERRWHIDEMCRFGDKVGRAAEAMQLSYLTTIHPQLGMIRVFPLPLLQRVYEIMAPQFQWPQIVEAELLEDGRKAKRDALKKNERADQLLAEITERADNTELLTNVQAVREFLKNDIAKLRQEIEPAVA